MWYRIIQRQPTGAEYGKWKGEPMSNDDQLSLLAAPTVAVVGPGASSLPGRAASALGWDGAVLDDVRLFGQRVVVIAEIDREAHKARLATVTTLR
jgi:hypothetical protein